MGFLQHAINEMKSITLQATYIQAWHDFLICLKKVFAKRLYSCVTHQYTIMCRLFCENHTIYNIDLYILY